MVRMKIFFSLMLRWSSFRQSFRWTTRIGLSGCRSISPAPEKATRIILPPCEVGRGVLELSILASTYVAISRSDRDSIIEAKRIIDSQLALAPSCEELVRQVNISTSKLTKGFSSLFGTSVHAYVIDQRLEKAASLLLESNLNVSQVAILVGYSKASNFAAAFKRKYGVNPKNYKAEATIG